MEKQVEGLTPCREVPGNHERSFVVANKFFINRLSRFAYPSLARSIGTGPCAVGSPSLPIPCGQIRLDLGSYPKPEQKLTRGGDRIGDGRNHAEQHRFVDGDRSESERLFSEGTASR